MTNILVAGAGTMGVVLARLFAQRGYAVTLWNRRQSSLDRAAETIRRDLDAAAGRGELSGPPEAVLDRITFTTDFAPFEGADFVIENIAEDLAVKRDFWAKVSALVPAESLLATNTSGLRVSDIARAVQGPRRFCGMHFWNPPDLMPLVEITKGEKTDDETAQAVRDRALSLEKRPVIVQKDILDPGQPAPVRRPPGGPPHPLPGGRRAGGDRRRHEVRPRLPLLHDGPL